MEEIREGLSTHVADKDGRWLPPSLSESRNWGLLPLVSVHGLAPCGEATVAAAAQSSS